MLEFHIALAKAFVMNSKLTQMKKLFLLTTFLFLGSLSAFSQDTQDLDRDKKGRYILPEAGDIGLGIEAGPFLRYAGNFFNSTQDNLDPSLLFKYGQSLYVKLFLDEEIAFRLSLGLTTFHNTDRRYVRDDNAFFNNPLSNDVIVDKKTYYFADYLLGFGIEFRRGYNRLQGFYGGGLFAGWEQNNTKYLYGNPYSQFFPTPTSYDFGDNLLANGDRVISFTEGNKISAGLNAFIGIEYFVLPKISVGGEVGLAGSYSFQWNSKYRYEHWTGSLTEENLQLISPGDQDISALIVNPMGGIYVMFHF